MDIVKWTPFRKQVFVVLGVSLNVAQLTLILGYAAALFHQLKQPDSPIPIDDDSGSWIASIVGITLFVGNILVAGIMGKYGRKIASVVAAAAALIGWIWISMSSSVTSILIARSLQGIHAGMATTLLPVVTGECSSPQNRAAFTSLSLLIVTIAMLCIHSLGAYLSWQTTAIIAAAVSFVDLLILIYIPETPSWLADQGRYEECKESFRWLRGDNEEDELLKIIEACKLTREVKFSTSSRNFNIDTTTKCREFFKLLVRREFYLPLYVVIHLYITNSWNGLILLAVYIQDYYRLVVGPDIDFGMHISLLDVSRIITTVFGIYLTKKVRRRVLLGATAGTNILMLFVTAFYAYSKLHKLLRIDHPFIGIVLSHLTYMSSAIGSSILPTTIASELFPLEFRSLAGGCSSCIHSLSFFVALKSVPYIVKTCNIHGLLLIYGFVLLYCLIATLLVLPETKDRTLQDIEDEMRGGKHRVRGHDETQSAVPLC